VHLLPEIRERGLARAVRSERRFRLVHASLAESIQRERDPRADRGLPRYDLDRPEVDIVEAAYEVGPRACLERRGLK